MKKEDENGKIEGKIDDLAVAVAKGFDVVHREIKDLRDDMKGLRIEMSDFKKEMKQEMSDFKKEINHTLEGHIKSVRSDYDGLSHRVKILETEKR